MIKQLSIALFILLFLCSSAFAAGNKIDKAIYNKISLSNKFYTNKTEALLLKTGQTTSYHADDDGDLELGIAHNYTVLTTGQYAGNTNITINGDTHATSNACVQDNRTGKMWHREVIQSDLGPANDGKFFWDQWTLSAETVTFTAADGKITADAGTPFSTSALCPGRKFTVVGSGVGNDGTCTVSAITTSVITTAEGVANEASIAIDFATTEDLVWDLKDQANASSLAGYTDWRIPNLREMLSLFNYGMYNPAIDPAIFPSIPVDFFWTSTTYASGGAFAWNVYTRGTCSYSLIYKQTKKYNVFLVRD